MSKKLRSFKKNYLQDIVLAVNEQFRSEFPLIDVNEHIVVMEKQAEHLLIMVDGCCPPAIARKLTLKLNAIQRISGYAVFDFNYVGSYQNTPPAASSIQKISH